MGLTLTFLQQFSPDYRQFLRGFGKVQMPLRNSAT